MYDFGSQFLGHVPPEPPQCDPWESRLVVYACGVITGLIVAALVVAR